ncbi:hypothetical protein BMF94_2811 [Rhodotorula taiwanensis]|uniref:Protein arginine methyltransferase NDUFAF7 n=1 Tax=Rhodotorula taiwanensis TaxID=741276 RepID=A0A2S5BB50_9BASI|nr:hypothetical protein BMF94_2811 [Rhodotorula taiwanensis]
MLRSRNVTAARQRLEAWTTGSYRSNAGHASSSPRNQPCRPNHSAATPSAGSLPPRPPRNAPQPSVKLVGGTSTVDKSTPSPPDAPPPKPSTGELLDVLKDTIKAHGPMPVSRYMTLCLQHPTLGYYTTRTVFGKEGDFITSPEISQVFGELLGIWYVTQWLAQGAPSKVRVIEVGPGRGTLLADILRTFRALPEHSRPPVSSIHLVEASEQLRGVQKLKLATTGFAETKTVWYGDIKEVPASSDEFTIFIAHEFFDALPIHNTQNGWREVLVDVADPKAIVSSAKAIDPLRLVLAPTPTPASALYSSLAQAIFPTVAHQQSPDLSSAAPAPRPSGLLNVDTTLGAQVPPSPRSAPAQVEKATSLIAQRFARLPIGSRLEVSPASWEIARDLAKLLGDGEASPGGAGLVVDYGDAKAFGRSWRGFRKHQVVDPLTEPGHTDLTANVDFAYLAEAMSETADTPGPISQGRFLTALGLQPRLAALLRSAPTEERRKEIESAARRLVDKTGMGEQYKVMGVVPKGKGQGVGEEAGVFPFNLQ